MKTAQALIFKALTSLLILAVAAGCDNNQKFSDVRNPSSQSPGATDPEPNPDVPENCVAEPRPTIEGNLYAEAGAPFTLTYRIRHNPHWIIWLPEGEQVFMGETISVTIQEAGQYRGEAWGQDNCQVRQSQPFTLTVLPPLGAPAISINMGAAQTTSADVTLSLAAANAQEMYITNDATCASGGSWEPFAPTKAWTLAMESADARVYAKFRTPAKESTCVSDGIYYDVTPPRLRFVEVPPAQSYSDEAHFEFAVSDNVNAQQTLLCALDGEAYKGCDLKHDVKGLEYGTHTMRIRAVDLAGNAAEDAYTWDYLNTPPMVRILTHPPLVADTRDAEFTFIGEDDKGPVTYECALDNAAFAECASPVRYTGLANGSYTFQVRARDSYGLYSLPATYAWKVNVEDIPEPDPIPPVVTLTRTPPTTTTDTVARFEFTATHSGVGIAGYYCALDGATPAPCSSPWDHKNLAVGPHKFEVYAVDNDELRSETVAFSWEVLKLRTPFTDHFTIDTPGRKLDIIIVDDNSPSMTEEQKKMAKRFSTFLSRLGDIDWQLAIITTDAKDGSKYYQDGRLLPMAGLKNTYVLNAKTPNLEKVFADTVVRKEWATDDEEGIRALYKMFLRPENRFFIRDQSHVASIIISDEDERSTGKNLKTHNTPENLIATFKQLFGNGNTYANHSIILMPGYDQKNCPQVGSHQYGGTYAKLSQLTGGVIGDICAADYGEILKNIGDAARHKTFTAKLKCAPAGPVDVKLTPQPATPIKSTVSGDEVTIAPYPPVGTQIAVTYDCD